MDAALHLVHAHPRPRRAMVICVPPVVTLSHLDLPGTESLVLLEGIAHLVQGVRKVFGLGRDDSPEPVVLGQCTRTIETVTEITDGISGPVHEERVHMGYILKSAPSRVNLRLDEKVFFRACVTQHEQYVRAERVVEGSDRCDG